MSGSLPVRLFERMDGSKLSTASKSTCLQEEEQKVIPAKGAGEKDERDDLYRLGLVVSLFGIWYWGG